MTEASSFARLEVGDDGVAVIWLDQPGKKVNTLSVDMLDEFAALLEKVAEDGAVRAAVMISAKEDFIAGADIEMLLGMTEPGQAAALSRRGNELLDRMEASRKPVVAAIHGACLGGGLEVAMACHARIATDHPRTVVGQPEVQLGILPGGGGTQRLPRLVGAQAALDMMLTGRRIFAKKAKKMGIVDALIHPAGLLEAARAMALERAAGKASRRRPSKSWVARLLDDTSIGRSIVFSQARKQTLATTRGNYPAPVRILDAVEAGLRHGRRAGTEAEIAGFDALAVTPVCKNLIRLFLGMTERKKNPMADQVRSFDRVAVLGAGFMGSGIVNVTAQKGVSVVMKDRDWDGVSNGQKHIWNDLGRKVKRKSMRPTERDRILSRIVPAVDYDGFDQVDVVIEAVFEDLKIKHAVVRELEEATGPDTLFASNTSALPIGQIAEASKRPENVIGMHYFSPVEKMPLLEIITTDRTADWVTATAIEIGILQGKTWIVVGDGPGFYTTRALAAFMNEAGLAIEEGADLREMDRALKDFGFPVGPVTLMDEVGLDVAAHVARDLGGAFAERGGETSTVVQRLQEAGFLGRKNGKGFFLYPKGRRGPLDKLATTLGLKPSGRPLNDDAERLLRTGATRAVPPAELVERLSMSLINECALCLQEGILRTPLDGDLGAILGFGFPPYLGGPFRYADALGAGEVVRRLDALRERFGPRFAAAELLREKAASDGRFYD